MAAAEKKAEPEGRPSLGKIRLDTACLQGGGGGCPAEKLLYVIFGIIGDNQVSFVIIHIHHILLPVLFSGILYAVHLADKDSFSKHSDSLNVGFLSDLFSFIDKYSPFNEVLESDEELIAKLRAQHEPEAASEDSEASPRAGVRVFTEAELRQYDGSPGSPGLYLALLGVVYDVAKGERPRGCPQPQPPAGRVAVLRARGRVQLLRWARRQPSLRHRPVRGGGAGGQGGGAQQQRLPRPRGVGHIL